MHAAAPAELLLRPGELVLFARADDHLHVAIEQDTGDRETDSLGASGDNGDLRAHDGTWLKTETIAKAL
jgi:hypothetical protein